MQRFDHVFGMRHHADYIASFIAYTSDIIHRPVGVGALDIAEHHLAFAFDAFQGFAVHNIIAFAMCHGARDDAAFYSFVSEKNFERI